MCDFDKTGVCAFHESEVERRKDNTKSTKEYVHNFFAVMTLVIIGSFTYTTISRSASEQADTELRESIACLTTNVAELSTMIAHDRGAMSPLIRQLQELNYNISAGNIKIHIPEP